MSIKEWDWMDRKDITQQHNWVIVKDTNVYKYKSWNEAVIINQMIGGHLMSEHYYENHYKWQNDRWAAYSILVLQKQTKKKILLYG